MANSRMINVQTSLCALLFALLAVYMGGCADVITYADRFERDGVRFYQQKAYVDAAGAFNNAIKQDPRHYRSYYYLASCYDEMGQHHEAIKSYWTALNVMKTTLEGREDVDQLRPKIQDALAQSIVRSDQRDVEIDAAEQQAAASHDGEQYLVLAKVYRLRGDADSAIRCYTAATLWSPKEIAFRKEFGLYLLDTCNQPQQAEYQLRRAYELLSQKQLEDQEVTVALRRLGVLPAAPAASANAQVEPAEAR